MLKELEVRMPRADSCRMHDARIPTFSKYKAKYDGLEVSHARRLRAPEGENGKLKGLLAQAMPKRDLVRHGPQTTGHL